MSQIDEIRARNVKRLEFEDAALCHECETVGTDANAPTAACDIDYLLPLLDKRTAALNTIRRLTNKPVCVTSPHAHIVGACGCRLVLSINNTCSDALAEENE